MDMDPIPQADNVAPGSEKMDDHSEVSSLAAEAHSKANDRSETPSPTGEAHANAVLTTMDDEYYDGESDDYKLTENGRLKQKVTQ